MTTVTVFDLEDLTHSAREQAIRNVQSERAKHASNYLIPEFVDSAKAFAKMYGFRVHDYEIGLFDHSYIVTVANGYETYTNEDKNMMVDKMNAKYKEEADGKCSLTGNYTDCYFFDYFRETKGTSYNTFHKDVPSAIEQALRTFMQDQEKDLTDNEYAAQYADEMGMEFLENGTIFC